MSWSCTTLSGAELAPFFAQLALHLRAGVAAGEALKCIADEATQPRIRRLATAMHATLASGTPATVAFEQQAGRFGAVIAGRLKQAQSDEDFAAATADIATFLDQRKTLDQRIAYLSAWERLTAIVAVVLLGGILVFVIPSFKEVFSSFGSELPALTQMIVGCSDLVVAYWYLLLLAWAGIHFGRKRVAAFAVAWDGLFLGLPMIGRRQKIVAAAMLADSTLFLERSGIPVAEAMRCALADVDNAALRKGWQAGAAALETGATWESALTASGVAPLSLLAHARRMPDQTPAALAGVVAANREAASAFVSGYSGWISRTFSILLGIFIALLVIGMYLPIFKLGSVV